MYKSNALLLALTMVVKILCFGVGSACQDQYNRSKYTMFSNTELISGNILNICLC